MGNDDVFDQDVFNTKKRIVYVKKTEKCVSCDCDTEYSINDPIDFRLHYIEGAGQLCSNCYEKTYNK